MDKEMLADLCIKLFPLLRQLYLKGKIDKKTYFKHLRTKLLFLLSICETETQQELKDIVTGNIDNDMNTHE